MTRSVYGGGGDAQVISTATGLPITAAAHVYTARTGGTVVTDILNMTGGALAGVVTPDSRGQILFQGPDATLATFWLDFGDGGPRWAVKPMDMDGSITAKRAALMQAEANSPSGFSPRSNLPYTTGNISQPLTTALDGKVPNRYASSAARDAAIPSPVDGDFVYNQVQHGFQYYQGGAARWAAMPGLVGDTFFANSTLNSVTISGIVSNWRALRLYFWGRAVGSTSTTSVFQPVAIQFNSDTAANYGSIGRVQRLKYTSASPNWSAEVAEDGTGGSAGTGSAMPTTAATYANLNNIASASRTSCFVGYVPGSSSQASQFGGGYVDILGYSSTSGHRVYNASSGFGNNAGGSGTGYLCNCSISGGWANTSAAISSITIFLVGSGLWATGSYIGLFGF